MGLHMAMKRRWYRSGDANKIPARPPRQHRVVSVSLGNRQANELKAISRVLANWRISSSEIARVAIDDLYVKLAGMKTTNEAAAYILERGRDNSLFNKLLTTELESQDERP